jgi:hypothetical protein
MLLPHMGLLPLGTYCFRKAITCLPAAASSTVDWPHAVDQAALAVGALVPVVHAVEHGVGLVHREHRAFDPHGQLRVGHHHGDLDDAVGVGERPVISRSIQIRFWSLLAARCRSWWDAAVPKPTPKAILAQAYTRGPCKFPLSTLAFAAALLLPALAVKFWLATRQMRHVAAHRHQVPAAFAATVTLEAHQKAADYTLAKGRFGPAEHRLRQRRAAGLDAAGRAGCC